MPKVTVKGPDGADLEIELPEGFLTREAAEAMANDKASKARRAAQDALLKDDEFKAAALKSWGVSLEPPKPPEPDVDVEKLKETLRAELVTPLEQTLKTKDAEVERLRMDRLVRDVVLAASRVGVKKALLQPVAAGHEPPIVAMVKGAFGYDAERAAFFLRDGDGFALSSNPTKEKLHADVDEFFDRWAKDKVNQDLLDQQRQSGAGFGNDRSAGGVITLSRADARDAAKYQQAHEQAKKTGATVQITE